MRLAGRCAAGFTMVELLVTVAIIALLAALLFPAVEKVGDAAHKTDVVHVMRNIGLGMQNHLADRARLPGPFYTAQGAADYNTGQANTLSGQLREYLGSQMPPKAETPPPLHPALATKRYKTWYIANKPTGGAASLYQMRARIAASGAQWYPWGYPNTPGQEQSNYFGMISAIQSDSLKQGVSLGNCWLLGDTYNPLIASGHQDYKARLFLDWHVETMPPATP